MTDPGKAALGLAVFDTVWLTGITIYLYKKIPALQAGMERQTSLLQDIMKLLERNRADWEQIPSMREDIKALDEKLNAVDADLAKIAKGDGLEDVEHQLQLMLAAFKQQGVEIANVVERSKSRRKSQPKRKKSRSRSHSRSERESETEDVTDMDPAEAVAQVRRAMSTQSGPAADRGGGRRTEGGGRRPHRH